MITAFDEAAKANGLKTISESLLALKPAINDAFATVTAVIPNMVAAFARLKNSIDIDVSGISQSIKSGFDLLNTALGEFAQNGELTQATIDKIKTKIAEIGPAAVAAWALMNPKSAIATLMPLLSGLGKIGVSLGKLAVEAQTSEIGRASYRERV